MPFAGGLQWNRKEAAMKTGVEMLACPFCGAGQPVVGATLDEGCYVMCRNEECFGMVGYFEKRPEAIAAWNTRQTHPAATGSVREALGNVPMGRFGHHPDPAIDFEIEVAEIESITESTHLGLTGPKHEADRAGLTRRIEVAMLFQVGGDPSCCAAKVKLCAIADAAPTPTQRRARAGVSVETAATCLGTALLTGTTLQLALERHPILPLPPRLRASEWFLATATPKPRASELLPVMVIPKPRPPKQAARTFAAKSIRPLDIAPTGLLTASAASFAAC